MNPSNPDFRTGYIAIIGRPNVGKSTLTNHIVGAKVSITSRKAQTTRHRIHGIYTDADAQYIFVDTPGFQTQYDSALNRGMNKTVVDALHSTDVVLFVIEGTRFDSRDQKVVDLLPKDIPVILVLNKQDLVKDKDSLLPFMAEMNEIFPFAAIVPISARNGEQVPRLLATIRGYLPVAEPMFDEDDITDKSERFLAAEIVREKVFRLSGEEVPYSASVMIEKFEQEGEMRRVFATILVDKENQKAIIIGHQGSKLKEIGTSARLDMERLFGGKVYLELWVKVKGGWADSERILKQLGYD
ncbi:MAG: GTPase Era [Sulfuriferula sp.]